MAPNIRVTEVSAQQELSGFLNDLGVVSVGDGARLTDEQMKTLSIHFACISEGFCNKFLPEGGPSTLTCCCGKIMRNDEMAYAFVWARNDGPNIDIDYAVLSCEDDSVPGRVISAVYHPIFPDRTTLSASSASQFILSTGGFKLAALRPQHKALADAFESCSKFH